MQAANIKKSDTVLEVGPGLGALTQKLLAQAEKVIAVEVDKNFEKILNKLNIDNNLEIIWQDILSLPSNDRALIYRMLSKLLRENQARI